VPFIPTLPDFEPKDLLLRGAVAAPTIMVRLLNRGAAFSGDVFFSLSSNTPSVGVTRQVTLSRGESREYDLGPFDGARLRASPCGLGSYVMVDPLQAIAEANEKNNSLSKTIYKLSTTDGQIVQPAKIGVHDFFLPVRNNEEVAFFIISDYIIKTLDHNDYVIFNLMLKVRNCGDQPISGASLLHNINQYCTFAGITGISLNPGQEAAYTIPIKVFISSIRAGHVPWVQVYIDGPIEADDLYLNGTLEFKLRLRM